MEEKNVSIGINLSDGSVNISGSEAFVEKNLECILNFVSQARGILPEKAKTILPLIEQEAIQQLPSEMAPEVKINNDDKDQYKRRGIYSVDAEDGTIAIHRKIPGNSNAEKMKNIALIVLYEKGGAIEGGALKSLCEKQGCWDRNNSAAIFEREYKLFIKKKISAQKWTIALTIDGEMVAKALLEDMASDNK